MTNRTLYLSFVAFAAATAINAQSTANAQTPMGDSNLMKLINQDLDQAQADFTLALTARTEKKIAARSAKLDNVFGPLMLADDNKTSEVVSMASNDAGAKLDSLVIARAEYEIAKDAANIENPFNPRLPMAPASVAFASEEQ